MGNFIVQFGEEDLAINFTGESVRDILVDSQGRTMIVGHFTAVNGITHKNAVRLKADGTIDSSFNIVDNNIVINKIIHASTGGGYIIVGEDRSSLKPYGKGIWKLKADGTFDSNFVGNFTLGPYGETFDVAIVQGENNLDYIVVGGHITHINNLECTGIGLIKETTGELVDALGNKIGQTNLYILNVCVTSENIYCLGKSSNKDVFGSFSVSGQRLYTDLKPMLSGVLDNPYQNKGVQQLLAHTNGYLYIIQHYATAGGNYSDTNQNRIIAFNPNTGEYVLTDLKTTVDLGDGIFNYEFTTPESYAKMREDENGLIHMGANATKNREKYWINTLCYLILNVNTTDKKVEINYIKKLTENVGEHSAIKTPFIALKNEFNQKLNIGCHTTISVPWIYKTIN